MQVSIMQIYLTVLKTLNCDTDILTLPGLSSGTSLNWNDLCLTMQSYFLHTIPNTGNAEL